MQAEGVLRQWTLKSAAALHKGAEKHHTVDVGIGKIMMTRMWTTMRKRRMQTIVLLLSIVIMQKKRKIMMRTIMMKMRTKSTVSLILDMKMKRMRTKTKSMMIVVPGGMKTKMIIHTAAGPVRDVVPIAAAALHPWIAMR
jgi:hypothetical protein